MKSPIRRLTLGLLAAASFSGVGCQSYQLGTTVPSPGILRDDIQYFPKGTDFPLTNELNAQQQAEVDRGAAIR